MTLIHHLSALFKRIFRDSVDPWRGAVSVAVAIFIACSPLFGFQTVLILAFSFLFKLHTPLALLASQISWPPTYFLIVSLEVWLGTLLTGERFQISQDSWAPENLPLQSWLLGFLIIGGFFALVSGGITYGMLFSWQKRQTLRVIASPPFDKNPRVSRNEGHVSGDTHLATHELPPTPTTYGLDR